MNRFATTFLKVLLAFLLVFGAFQRGAARAELYSDRPTILQPLVKRSSQGRERVIAETMLLQARILQKQNRPEEALRKYHRAWRLTDRSTTVLKQIIPLAMQLGRVEEATRYGLLLKEADLDDPFLAERLAVLMSDQLEYERSLELYQHVLKLRSEDPDARNPIAMQFEMGRLYFLTGQHPQAAQAFRVVLESLVGETQDPFVVAFRQAVGKDVSSVYSLMAEAFLEAGALEEAETAYRRANNPAPHPQWLTLQLARVDYHAGRFSAAEEKLQDYVRQKLRFGGQTPYALLQAMMERAHAVDKNTDVADTDVADTDVADTDVAAGILVRFRDWVADDPENPQLLSYVAAMTHRQGGGLEAAQLYEKSLSGNPSPDVHRQLLRIYHELKDTDELLNTFRRIVELGLRFEGVREEVNAVIADPELLEDLLQLGRERLKKQTSDAAGNAVACGLLALDAKNYDAAETFFEGAANLESDLYVAWGLRLLADEEVPRAVKVFRRGLASARDANIRAILRYYLSGTLQLEGETDEALIVAREVADQSKHIPEFVLRPAWILYAAKRTEEARRAYVEWLDTYAENYNLPGVREVVRDARFVVSNIYMELGEIDNAIEALESVLDEYPDDIAAMNDLGYLLVDHGQSLPRATAMIRRAVDREPDNVAYRDSLGWALFRLQQFDEAIVELQKAASGEQPDPIILDHLAEAQRASGDQGAARETWQRAYGLLESGTHEELRRKIKTKLDETLSTVETE